MLDNYYAIKERLYFKTDSGFEGYRLTKVGGALLNQGEEIYLRTVFPPKLWGYNSYQGRKIPKCSWKVKITIKRGEEFVDDEEAINLFLDGGQYEYLNKYIKAKQGDVIKLFHKSYERDGVTKSTIGYAVLDGYRDAESGRPANKTGPSKRYEQNANKYQQDKYNNQEVDF